MTIFGWDLSHYDAPDSRAAVSEGFSFFTHKAGGDANDAEIGTWWSYMKGYRDRVLLGAYWVLYPGSPVTRANAFCDRLDSQCPGWGDTPFMLQVDCEKWGGDASTVPSKSDIKAFCDQLRVRAPKLMPIVYAPEWVYGNTLSGLGYPLWASNYSSASSGTAIGIYSGIGGDGSSRWHSYSGQVPAILQYTSSATIAGQTTCDANAFRGTLQELTALVAPGWSTPVATLDADDLTNIANKVLKLDGVILNAPGAGDIATNPEISLATGVQRIYDLVQRMYNAPPIPATVDVPSLAAALAPLLNGVTEQEIKDALESVRFTTSG